MSANDENQAAIQAAIDDLDPRDLVPYTVALQLQSAFRSVAIGILVTQLKATIKAGDDLYKQLGNGGPKELLYRCPICGDEKVETAHVVTLFCRKGHTLPQPMQYLGDQPAGEAANKRAEKLDPAEILEALINLEGLAHEAGNDTTKYQDLIKRFGKENPYA